MATPDELLNPILHIAAGKVPPRRDKTRRYSEFELRRRLEISRDRVDSPVASALADLRKGLATVLREHAEMLPDGRIAIETAAIQNFLDQLHSAMNRGSRRRC